MVVDVAHQIRYMDLVYHHLETTRQENTTREISKSVEGCRGQLLEGHTVIEDSGRQVNLETTC